ncbi:MAG: MerR family transcriptional regulator [Acidobacteriaceae bacterium]
MADKAHIYNLKAVMNEVGLGPATLRAWERRYGLLKPQRSAGGHRLYSRKDIEMLKWLVERQKDGLSISQAVEMWKNQHGREQERLGQSQVPYSNSYRGGTLLDELRRKWLSACMVFDDQAANQVLDRAFAIAPAETICAEVLQKGLAEMGDRWYVGSASVQQEHFAATSSALRINALLAAAISPYRHGHILVACPPFEEHSLALLMVTYLLRRNGWDVVYLGENVPLQDLDSTLQLVSPELVISAAQTLPGAASLRLMAEMTGHEGVNLAYGGGIFTRVPSASRSIPGFYLGNEIAQVPHMVEGLMIGPAPTLSVQEAQPAYTQVLAAFKKKAVLIGTQALEAMKDQHPGAVHLEAASTDLNQHIQAALALGDIQLLEQPIAWLDGLLKNYGISTEAIDGLFQAYTQALESNLGGEGAVITDFLKRRKPSSRRGS